MPKTMTVRQAAHSAEFAEAYDRVDKAFQSMLNALNNFFNACAQLVGVA